MFKVIKNDELLGKFIDYEKAKIFLLSKAYHVDVEVAKQYQHEKMIDIGDSIAVENDVWKIERE